MSPANIDYWYILNNLFQHIADTYLMREGTLVIHTTYLETPPMLQNALDSIVLSIPEFRYEAPPGPWSIVFDPNLSQTCISHVLPEDFPKHTISAVHLKSGSLSYQLPLQDTRALPPVLRDVSE